MYSPKSKGNFEIITFKVLYLKLDFYICMILYFRSKEERLFALILFLYLQMSNTDCLPVHLLCCMNVTQECFPAKGCVQSCALFVRKNAASKADISAGLL